MLTINVWILAIQFCTNEDFEQKFMLLVVGLTFTDCLCNVAFWEKKCFPNLQHALILSTFRYNSSNSILKIIRPHCVKRQARDDAQRQQVKLLFFVGFVISVKQKHPSLPYNLPLWSCKPVVDGSPIRCNRQVWVSSTPFVYTFIYQFYPIERLL